jgi:hypothetical protein
MIKHSLKKREPNEYLDVRISYLINPAVYVSFLTDTASDTLKCRAAETKPTLAMRVRRRCKLREDRRCGGKSIGLLRSKEYLRFA